MKVLFLHSLHPASDVDADADAVVDADPREQSFHPRQSGHEDGKEGKEKRLEVEVMSEAREWEKRWGKEKENGNHQKAA